MLQRLENEQLPHRARDRKLNQRPEDVRVFRDPPQRALELCLSGDHARRNRVNNRNGRQREGDQRRSKEGSEEVEPEHHLLPCDVFVPAEDFVLRAVRRAVDDEIDEQEEDTPRL